MARVTTRRAACRNYTADRRIIVISGRHVRVIGPHGDAASFGTVLAEEAANFLKGTAVKSILDPSFRYRSSVNTDLKSTFARIRRAQKKKQPGTLPRSEHSNVLRMANAGRDSK